MPPARYTAPEFPALERYPVRMGPYHAAQKPESAVQKQQQSPALQTIEAFAMKIDDWGIFARVLGRKLNTATDVTRTEKAAMECGASTPCKLKLNR